MSARYATTVNGNIHAEHQYVDRPRWPIPHDVASRLDRMDGTGLFSVCLWALPPDTAFDQVKLDRWPQQYIQAAGTRDRMTVEIRRDAPAGERHFVVGWSKTIETEPSEQTRWGKFSTVVCRVELFSAALAVPLFLSYMQTGDIPPGYTERPLDL